MGSLKRFRTLFAFEYHIFSVSIFLQVVEVSLSGNSVFQHIPYSPQFDVICKLPESAFCVLVHIGDVKQHKVLVLIHKECHSKLAIS